MDPEAVAQHVRADLERLVAVPSVAFPGYPEAPVLQAAELTAEILRDAGLRDVELLGVPGGPPAVFGVTPGPPGAPTVLLYAHYDVQPAGPEELWTTSPWTLTERDGRLAGRGAADDKYAIAMHAGVLRAFDGAPPVTVKVVVEGDEETGRGTFEQVLAADPERFAADLVVVADAGNPVVGEPALTTSLRAMAVLDVTVRTLAGPVHSGLFGGAAPDALLALSRMIASLHDDAGDVAVAGLEREAWNGRPVAEDAFRRSAGVREGVGLVGTGTVAERVYARPAVSVIGMDVPTVETAGNAVLPEARARVSARLPPLADAQAATEALAAHLRAHAPWGVDVEITPGPEARGFRLVEGGTGDRAAREALEAAYGRPAVAVGSGGAIPLVAALAEALPAAEILLWGAADEACRMHAADESVDAGELDRATRAEVELLRRLGAQAVASSASVG